MTRCLLTHSKQDHKGNRTSTGAARSGTRRGEQALAACSYRLSSKIEQMSIVRCAWSGVVLAETNEKRPVLSRYCPDVAGFRPMYSVLPNRSWSAFTSYGDSSTPWTFTRRPTSEG